jgi:UDP-N-acetylglucosamine transferase subunit ALG13
LTGTASASPNGVGPADVLVMLGTDHHPFTRLVEWVDRWSADHPESVCVIQYGTAAPPRHAEGHPFLDPVMIPRLMGNARAVVGHAGPGTLLDARLAGRLPILVPRLARNGEVVDDHQVTFGRWMHDRHKAVCVEDEGSLRSRIDEAVADPQSFVVPTGPDHVPPAVTLLGDLVDGMLTR